MKISFLVTYYQQKQYIAQSMEALLALNLAEPEDLKTYAELHPEEDVPSIDGGGAE